MTSWGVRLGLAVVAGWGIAVGAAVAAEDADPPGVYRPVLEGEPWKVCVMPDLGALAGPEARRQHIVDHSFIQDAEGRWRLWACIRGTKVSRLIYGWVGDSLDKGPWEPTGVMLRADPDYDEHKTDSAETVGAPFFLRVGETWNCFYHGRGIRRATSTDGIHYARVRNEQGSSRTEIPGGRDVMIFPHEGRFYSYATVTTSDGKRSYVVGSQSQDLESWTPGKIVREGGRGGQGPVAAESPCVLHHEGRFYLFRASSHDFKTYVYHSRDPLDFGIDDDANLVAVLPLKAPEVLRHEGTWYISDLGDFQGILLRRFRWEAVQP